jgi:NhaA family Na+:H+ antiporter
VLGVGTAAGIGFSVALFISELAFADPGNQAEAKLAILLASLIAAAISLLLLVDRRRRA